MKSRFFKGSCEEKGFRSSMGKRLKLGNQEQDQVSSLMQHCAKDQVPNLMQHYAKDQAPCHMPQSSKDQVPNLMQHYAKDQERRHMLQSSKDQVPCLMPQSSKDLFASFLQDVKNHIPDQDNIASLNQNHIACHAALETDHLYKFETVKRSAKCSVSSCSTTIPSGGVKFGSYIDSWNSYKYRCVSCITRRQAANVLKTIPGGFPSIGGWSYLSLNQQLVVLELTI